MKTTDTDLLCWLGELRKLYLSEGIRKAGSTFPNDLTAEARYWLRLIGYRTTELYHGGTLPQVFACGSNVVAKPDFASLKDIEQLFEYFEVPLQVEDTVSV